MSISNQTQILISEAREILEEAGETCPVYVSFERDSYTFSCEQVKKIAYALYSADCEIMDLIKKLDNNGKETI